MAVTLFQLVEAFRQRVDDLTDNSVTCDWYNDDTGLLWKNSEVVRYANQAQREYCRVHPVFDGTSSFTAIALVDGQREYNLDPRIVYVQRAEIAGESLGKLSQQYLDDNYPYWEQRNGTPEFFYTKLQPWNLIGFYPLPDTDDDGVEVQLYVARMPLSDMELGRWYVDQLEISDRDAYELLPYMCYLAYQKRDANTYNPKAADAALNEFKAKIGASPSVVGDKIRHEQQAMPQRVRLRDYT